VNAKDKIIETTASAFFPELPDATKRAIISLIPLKFGAVFVGAASELILKTGYQRDPNARGSLKDLAGEKRLRLFSDTISTLNSSFDYLMQGLDKDILNEFPAQRLICVRTDVRELVNWKKHWQVCGGNLYGDEMVALKWDSVWKKISAFNFPFPPFQLGSGYDVEDVDRDETESLGIKVPQINNMDVKIEIDTDELRQHFASSLIQLESQ
jgi:hypothetical protein